MAEFKNAASTDRWNETAVMTTLALDKYQACIEACRACVIACDARKNR